MLSASSPIDTVWLNGLQCKKRRDGIRPQRVFLFVTKAHSSIKVLNTPPPPHPHTHITLNQYIYRRPSLFKDFLSLNSLIHIRKMV